MAITPRTFFTNPTVALASAFGLLTVSGLATVLCSLGSPCNVSEMDAYNPCRSVLQMQTPHKSSWSEREWARYAECFSAHNDSIRVISVSTEGLRHHPRSEALYNAKGLHLGKQRRFEESVAVLREGLRKVGTPTSAQMTNNLAWFGMSAPRSMDLNDARGFYTHALRFNPRACTIVHTGMMVEHALARQTDGFERVEALRRFGDLSERYTPCHSRYRDGDWDSMSEVFGAAVAMQDINNRTRFKHIKKGQLRDFGAGDKLSRNVLDALDVRYARASDAALCQSAMPAPHTHTACLSVIKDSKKMVYSDRATKKRTKRCRKGLRKNTKDLIYIR